MLVYKCLQLLNDFQGEKEQQDKNRLYKYLLTLSWCWINETSNYFLYFMIFLVNLMLYKSHYIGINFSS